MGRIVVAGIVIVVGVVLFHLTTTDRLKNWTTAVNRLKGQPPGAGGAF